MGGGRERRAGPEADPGSLPGRFRRELCELGASGPGDGLVVAVSGGVDSLVLLHLLRFRSELPPSDLVAAHLDHGMRPESADDASWIRGLLRAWNVEGRFHGLSRVPTNEEEARVARYDFLREVREQTGATWILTAHHADDQAETVLFRVLRGTGLRGLRGIPAKRGSGIVRPLLPFWKEEIRSYARRVGLRPRFDESNEDLRFARNVLRHDVLPGVEERVAPGARRALVRLARLARREEAAWESLAPDLLDSVTVSAEGPPGDKEGRVVLDRSAFLAFHPAVRARLLRRLLRDRGVRLDESGTRAALAFTSESVSGARWSLPGDLVLTREFDRLVVAPATEEEAPDVPLRVASPEPGRGGFTVGGRAFEGRWGRDRTTGATWTETFSRSDLLFPIRFRGWSPGDRIRLPVGSRKLKKIFGEERVPVRDRHRWPLVADAEERVLWIPGLARSTGAVPRGDDDVFFIGITDVGDD